MFIKVTDIDDRKIIVNTDKIEVVVTNGNELALCFEENTRLFIKGDIDEFYQRLIKADRKDQH